MVTCKLVFGAMMASGEVKVGVGATVPPRYDDTVVFPFSFPSVSFRLSLDKSGVGEGDNTMETL